MVENLGIVHPDCEHGNKHVPSFAEAIVRDPLMLAQVAAGKRGLIWVCRALPTSFPGFLLLTEDLAEVNGYDHCPCGRRGTSFRFAGRAPRPRSAGAAIWKGRATSKSEKRFNEQHGSTWRIPRRALPVRRKEFGRSRSRRRSPLLMSPTDSSSGPRLWATTRCMTCPA